MTVGEKIQQYRKRAGLSQEELGRQLLVSRQTISLWENGQTLPTLDNLIRLREIFGTSIDEMLCEETAAEEQNGESLSAPLEKHEFIYSEAELRALRRHESLPSLLGLILSAAVFAIGLICFVLLQSLSEGTVGMWGDVLSFIFPMVLGAWIGAFAVGIPLFAWRFWHIERRTAHTVSSLRDYTHTLEIYADRIALSSYRNGELRACREILAEAILYRVDGEQVTVLVTRDGELALPYILAQGSEWIRTVPERDKRPMSHLQKYGLLALFVASFVAVGTAVTVAAILFGIGYPYAKKTVMTVSFVLASLPLASLVWSLLARRGRRYLKNVIAGALAIAVLCGGGFLCAWIGGDPIGDLSRYASMTLPTYTGLHVETVDEKRGAVFVYYEAEIYFEGSQMSEWESATAEATCWYAGAFADLTALYPHADFARGADRVMLYDITGETCHKISESSGYHSYLVLSYFEAENLMRVAKCNVKVG
ncbi:MAG: helix-turn-helix domain-containing protein [Clostridia bacterium]|nr:helix-turn-helix domain-containing protein [Clostridia bacterium]